MKLKRLILAQRRGVSPLLAELTLIAVTLIAAVLVGGWTFQTMGVSTRTAEVQAQLDSCEAQGSTETCTLSLLNSGASNVDASSCAIGSAEGRISSAGTVPADGALNGISCSVTGDFQVGTLVTGWVGLSNGGAAYFAGSA